MCKLELEKKDIDDKLIVVLQKIKSWYPKNGRREQIISFHEGEYCNTCFPEFSIVLKKHSKSKLRKIKNDYYWMSELCPSQQRNSYLYKIDILYHSTLLYTAKVISVDHGKFNRTLWKNSSLWLDDDTKIYYCYIEQDTIDYAIDNWLCNMFEINEENFYMHQSFYEPPIDFYNNPYDDILIFKNKDERIEFENYLLLNKNRVKSKLLEITDTYKIFISNEIMRLSICSKVLKYIRGRWTLKSNTF